MTLAEFFTELFELFRDGGTIGGVLLTMVLLGVAMLPVSIVCWIVDTLLEARKAAKARKSYAAEHGLPLRDVDHCWLKNIAGESFVKCYRRGHS